MECKPIKGLVFKKQKEQGAEEKEVMAECHAAEQKIVPRKIL
jgi:hypothetical protein